MGTAAQYFKASENLASQTGISVDVTNQYVWNYDDAGRLIYESFDSTGESLDYVDTFRFDGAGNRLETARVWADASNHDYVTTYQYDANDRLLVETKDYVDNAVDDEVTTYGYDQTQQTSKSVEVDGSQTTLTEYEYNLQGRMSLVKQSTFDSGAQTGYSETSYDYDSDGNRVAKTVKT